MRLDRLDKVILRLRLLDALLLCDLLFFERLEAIDELVDLCAFTLLSFD